METAVALRNVCKHYEDFSLNDVSLTIPQGYIMGLIGQNGSGKTTLIKMMMNLLLPDSGEVSVFGKPFAGNEEAIKSRIGFVHEHPDYFRFETVKRIGEIVAPFSIRPGIPRPSNFTGNGSGCRCGKGRAICPKA